MAGLESSRRVLGGITIQKATKENERSIRFSISRWRHGKGRVKYVPLGKISKEDYAENQEEIDSLCNIGDIEGLLSKKYFVLKEEKDVLQDKITDFFKK